MKISSRSLVWAVLWFLTMLAVSLVLQNVVGLCASYAKALAGLPVRPPSVLTGIAWAVTGVGRTGELWQGHAAIPMYVMAFLGCVSGLVRHPGPLRFLPLFACGLLVPVLLVYLNSVAGLGTSGFWWLFCTKLATAAVIMVCGALLDLWLSPRLRPLFFPRPAAEWHAAKGGIVDV